MRKIDDDDGVEEIEVSARARPQSLRRRRRRYDDGTAAAPINRASERANDRRSAGVLLLPRRYTRVCERILTRTRFFRIALFRVCGMIDARLCK